MLHGVLKILNEFHGVSECCSRGLFQVFSRGFKGIPKGCKWFQECSRRLQKRYKGIQLVSIDFRGFQRRSMELRVVSIRVL